MSRTENEAPLIEVRNLGVRFRDGWGWRQAVEGVSFTLAPGQCVALVGESGSGKSVSARSLLGLHGPEARVNAEVLRFRGQDLLGLRERQWRALRGRGIGYILQDALVSLDPLRTIGQELAEAIRATSDGSRRLTRAELRAESLGLLARAGFADAGARLDDHPAQLSGGQRQRALIASAIAGQPPVLIADEPTTALDVSVQQQVLDLFAQLKRSGIALILISHDLGVVSQLADEVLILQRGRVVESGSAFEVLRRPRQDYTRRLIEAVPRFTRGGPAPASAVATPPRPTTEPLLRVTGIRKRFEGRHGAPARDVLHGVSLSLHAGRTLGLVGESGSGKTTLARIVAGLEPASEGRLDPGPALAQPRDWRARPVQYVYQDPLSAFDPRYTVGRVLGEALEMRFGRERASQRQARVHEWLQRVGLDPALAARRPLTLSGGQRQRVAIARALAVQPRLVVMDEPVSALDVSVQKQVLALIAQLQRDTDAAFLFISHDLGVVQQVSHDVAVMHQGRLVEQGDAASVLQRPTHPYTRALIDAVPALGV